MCRKPLPGAEKTKIDKTRRCFPALPRGNVKKISKFLKINKINDLRVLVEMKLYIIEP